MDSRNVNFSIKKSQIDTHMLGLAQKLTKLDIALEGQVFHGILGLVPKNWPWKGFCLPFTAELLDYAAESVQKFIKNARNRRKLAETWKLWEHWCLWGNSQLLLAPSVVNLVSWSGKNWVGPCLYLEDLSQSLNRRWH